MSAIGAIASVRIIEKRLGRHGAPFKGFGVKGMLAQSACAIGIPIKKKNYKSKEK